MSILIGPLMYRDDGSELELGELVDWFLPMLSNQATKLIACGVSLVGFYLSRISDYYGGFSK